MNNFPSLQYSIADVRKAGKALAGPIIWEDSRRQEILDIFAIAHSWRDAHIGPMRSIPSSLVRIVPHATPLLFGILTSRMHNAWLKIIGGRMKSDPRYSIGIVYNPFPMPVLDDKLRDQIAVLAEKVLEERRKWMPTSSLAHLYDPLGMPTDLKAAHRKLDAIVDRAYRKEPFVSDRNRVEHLMGVYERERAALLELAIAPRKVRMSRSVVAAGTDVATE